MPLLPDPVTPSVPLASAQPGPKLRWGALGGLAAGVIVSLLLMTTGSGGAVFLGLLVLMSSAGVATAVLCRKVVVGDGWVAGRAFTSWKFITLKDTATVSSASHALTGDWLLIKDANASVALSSAFEGAIEVMDVVAPQLRKARIDVATRERLG